MIPLNMHFRGATSAKWGMRWLDGKVLKSPNQNGLSCLLRSRDSTCAEERSREGGYPILYMLNVGSAVSHV